MVVFLLVVLGVALALFGLKSLSRWRRGLPIIPPRKEWKRWVPGSERTRIDPSSEAMRNPEAARIIGQGRNPDSGGGYSGGE